MTKLSFSISTFPNLCFTVRMVVCMAEGGGEERHAFSPACPSQVHCTPWGWLICGNEPKTKTRDLSFSLPRGSPFSLHGHLKHQPSPPQCCCKCFTTLTHFQTTNHWSSHTLPPHPHPTTNILLIILIFHCLPTLLFLRMGLGRFSCKCFAAWTVCDIKFVSEASS